MTQEIQGIPQIQGSQRPIPSETSINFRFYSSVSILADFSIQYKRHISAHLNNPEDTRIIRKKIFHDLGNSQIQGLPGPIASHYGIYANQFLISHLLVKYIYYILCVTQSVSSETKQSSSNINLFVSQSVSRLTTWDSKLSSDYSSNRLIFMQL